jgi:hypothetical protein
VRAYTRQVLITARYRSPNFFANLGKPKTAECSTGGSGGWTFAASVGKPAMAGGAGAVKPKDAGAVGAGKPKLFSSALSGIDSSGTSWMSKPATASDGVGKVGTHGADGRSKGGFTWASDKPADSMPVRGAVKVAAEGEAEGAPVAKPAKAEIADSASPKVREKVALSGESSTGEENEECLKSR